MNNETFQLLDKSHFNLSNLKAIRSDEKTNGCVHLEIPAVKV